MKNLTVWQSRLTTHFEGLRNLRIAMGTDMPIFGLEHGLTSEEVLDLEAAVRDHIARRPLDSDHWLTWIVYSAELGYRYTGDEYWQTFEQESPGWEVNGNRHGLREFFRKFEREFGGAVPKGTWAEHFSIICWPITHAILPKDLQRQLARTLYEARYRLTGDLIDSPEALGDLIAARSWNASSRFQNLAQERALVGQIAAALLFQNQGGASDFIFSSTLERICRDLEQERQAREWLMTARRSANEPARLRGIKPRSQGNDPNRIRQLGRARAEVTALGIEPRIILRPTDNAGETWEAFLEIPDLSHLLLRFPQTREMLTDSRCFVAGTSSRPLARGRLLHGSQRVKLVSWPKPESVLLKFERGSAQFDFLMRTDCLLRPGPRWLLRIESDGLAYECKSFRVRPGERYIVLGTDQSQQMVDLATPIDVDCLGIDGLFLDLPESLNGAWQIVINDLGLAQGRFIEVWPAGLTPKEWDGEGYGEWRASDRPCVAIFTDHPLTSLHVSAEDHPEDALEIPSVEAGESVFIELPRLPVGIHKLWISARSMLAGRTEQPQELEAVVRIVEDRSASMTVDPRGPLSVLIDPPSPSLDQLWEGKVEISILGPETQIIDCTVSMSREVAGTPFFTKELPAMLLPVHMTDWRSYFAEHLKTDVHANDAYEQARNCTLLFDASELGAFELQCERPFAPLRWSASRRRGSRTVQLLDDSGQPEQPRIGRIAFETPCVEEPLFGTNEFDVPSSGGLFSASTVQQKAALIVPPILEIQGFSGLTLTPKVTRFNRSSDSAMRVIESANMWGHARLYGGSFSAMRRREVILALVHELFRILCGDDWARAEDFLRENNHTGSLEFLSQAISRRPTEIGVNIAMLRETEKVAHENRDRRIEFLASVAVNHDLLPRRVLRISEYGAETDNTESAIWLAELALRLGSDPTNAEDWAGEDLRAGIIRLMDIPLVARAARFLVLSSELYLGSPSVFGELFQGWRWE